MGSARRHETHSIVGPSNETKHGHLNNHPHTHTTREEQTKQEQPAPTTPSNKNTLQRQQMKSNSAG
jgi:hypothetical protein